MAIFLELTTDAFEASFNRAIEDADKRRRAGTARARRPFRGLEIKEDTYALLKVVTADGRELPLLDSSSESGESAGVTNFILQSVSERRMEKHQIVETFGEAYIFFFGEHPRFLDVSAVLLNSNDFNWEAEFWENYERFLRGTRLVEMGARTYLFFDDTIVEGYMLQAQAEKVAEQPLSVALSFRLFVTNYSTVSLVGEPSFPIRPSVNLPPSVNLTTADAFTVGRAAVGAAEAAALDQMNAEEVALGDARQARGFGGGSKLANALRSGLASGADLTGITNNALMALVGMGLGGDLGPARTKPLRGAIADNLDEYTSYPPPRPKPDADATEEARDGSAEVEAPLPTALTREAARYGADLDQPWVQNALGLGVTFDAALRASFGAAVSARASFTGGAAAGAGLHAGVSSIPGGSVQLGGVPVGGGLATGIGGGASEGLGAGLAAGWRLGPGRRASASYAGAGVNASVLVGGTPTCFAVTSVPGTLTPADLQGGLPSDRRR